MPRARTMVGIAWIWPLVTIAFAVQVTYALVARLLTPAVAVPLLLYNLCVATIATSDYLVSISGSAPLWLQGAVAARDAVAGFAFGRSALVSPLTVLVPMIAPAYPARWKASAGVRALLTIAATAASTLLLMQWPPAVGAIRSYDLALGARLQERPQNDFAIGLRAYSRVNGAPSERLVKADFKLADTIRARVMMVVLTEKGTRAGALDSLARVLEPFRADSATIAIALELPKDPGVPGNKTYLEAVERVLLRVRPDVLIPGWRAPISAVFPGRDPELAWWQSMYSATAGVVTRVRPRTRLAWAAARADTRDSIVYDWAASEASPVRVLGVMAYPSFAGLPAVDARLRAFDRWHELAVTLHNTNRTHWIMEAGGLPRAHGDAAQTAAIMQALSWGSRRPWVTAAIVGDASDYDAATGLRAANGRWRSIVGVLATANANAGGSVSSGIAFVPDSAR
ncbi:MAG: hypothetical protein ACO1Q7_15940 [Gemmatimonas sp.]